jgi:hypothetical protein
MTRNTKSEKAWANTKYGKQLIARCESPEQYDEFRAILREQGTSYAAWLQSKVREEIKKRGGK